MTNFELYNYIKDALSKGKTKDEITTTLMQVGGWSWVDINNAFVDVQNGNQPAPNATQAVKIVNQRSNRIKIAVAVIFTLLICLALYYFFIKDFLK